MSRKDHAKNPSQCMKKDQVKRRDFFDISFQHCVLSYETCCISHTNYRFLSNYLDIDQYSGGLFLPALQQLLTRSKGGRNTCSSVPLKWRKLSMHDYGGVFLVIQSLAVVGDL